MRLMDVLLNSSLTENRTLFFGERSTSALRSYHNYHGYVSGAICFLGIVGNILNFIVWWKSSRTFITLLLVALAVADTLSLVFYLIFVLYFFIATKPSNEDYHSLSGMYLVLVSFHQFLVFHTTSSWLTVSMAIFRYLKVCKPESAVHWCTIKRSKIAIVVVFLATMLAAIPNYPFYEVYTLEPDDDKDFGFWIRRTSYTFSQPWYPVSLMWVYGVSMKIVPCFILTVLSSLMIRHVRKAERRVAILRLESMNGNATSIRSTEYVRTTSMLIVLIFIYILTELPIGITSFISGLKGRKVHLFYFLLSSELGDALDISALINSAVNFVVYMTMNTRFRETFSELIC